MGPLLDAIAPEFAILSDDTSQYQRAYLLYVLCQERFLTAMSVAARANRLPNFTYRTESQKRLARRYTETRRYLELDLINLVLHTRILLDRAIGLSHRFLPVNLRPSFSSFSDHKKFFCQPARDIGDYGDYASHFRNNTEWFETPLKIIRDKYIVHLAPKHMQFLGWPNDHELHFNVLVPSDGRSMAGVRVLSLSPFRLSYEVEAFLSWFANYGAVRLKD